METYLSQCISELYGLAVVPQVTRPAAEFGDYATNVALQLARPVGKNPQDIAQELAAKLRQGDAFTEVTVAGPGFINVRLSGQSLAQQLDRAWGQQPQYGNSTDGAGKTAVVEYPSPNMAKPYSVGHLRPGNQGWAARQLLLATGWTVITDNHLGDYGAPLGTWITGFLHFSSDDALQKDGVYELGRVYIQTKKALKDEAARGQTTLADEVQSWLLKFEAGDPQAVAYSQRFNAISLEHIHTVMQRLGIYTDYELGEAFFAPMGKQAVQQLLQSGAAVQNNDGSVVVPLDEFGFEVPMLIQKSNGAALYATTDLATLLYREQQWHPDMVVYCAGAEQQFYFSQLFAVAHKIGIKADLFHLWFGVIDQQNDDGSREKMSSRKGVVLMEELLNEAEAKARTVVAGRDDVTDEDIKKIALGAIKFNDFISDRRTNILFDWNTIFALTGMSGPYVQYAAVRVNKILQDNAQALQTGTGPNSGLSDVSNSSPSNEPNSDTNATYDYGDEKDILLKLLDYPAVVSRSARELEPHKVANYLYELAKTLNRYYEHTPVATAQVPVAIKQARLQLLQKVSHVFTHGLDLLGVQVPTRM